MRTVKPVFEGTRGLEKPNYGPCYVGFSFNNDSIFSEGIVWFTEGESEAVKVSHSFIVLDEKNLVEATMGGVQINPLSKYFDNPHYAVFFKKLKDVSEEQVKTILEWAKSHVGDAYDYSLILSYLIWIERLKPFRKYPSIFNRPGHFLCSEFVAEALNEISDYKSVFPLSEYHTSKIAPIDIFHSEIFKPWDFTRGIDEKVDSG